MVDACAFHDWSAIKEITEYMPQGWQQLALHPGVPGGPNSFREARMYSNPWGAKDSSARHEGESTLDALVRNVLDRPAGDRVVLGYDDGLMTSAYRHPYAAQVAVRATNDWTVDRWLSADERLYGMVLISTSDPQIAAGEIRRVGKNERMVAVALGATVLDKTFGHPVYNPVYEACTELSLPVVIQTGCENFGSHLMPLTGGGLPTTYSEYYALNSQPIEAHVSRLIFHGVFDRFPSLKVLTVGGGLTWVPSLLWKMDFARNTAWAETPWLQRPPSEYFREHIRVATYQMEKPTKAGGLLKALKTVPWFRSVLLYASGYPLWDWARREDVAAEFPADWHDEVFESNAAEFFRWPGSQVRPPAGGLSAEGMISTVSDEYSGRT